MKQISSSIPDDLREELEKIAQDKKRSISWVVREILQDYIDNQVKTKKE